MSGFSVIENEFDNFDNYNLNLLLIKRIILRSRKQGSPHAHLMNSIPSQRIEYSQERQESGTCPKTFFTCFAKQNVKTCF